MEYLNTITYLGVLIYASNLGARSKYLKLLSLISGIFFYKNIAIQSSFHFDIWKACLIIAMLFLSLKMFKVRVPLKITTPSRLVFFYFVYLLLASLIASFIFSYFKGYSGQYQGFFNREGRLVTQAAYYLFCLSLFAYSLIAIRSADEFSYVLINTYKWIYILACLGILQFIVYTVFGYNLFPINRFGQFDETAAFINSGGVQDVFRINSLAGEPKHLALAICLALALQISAWIAKYKNPVFSKFKLLVLIFALTFTYSTTGYVLFLLFSAVGVVYGYRRLKAHQVILGFLSIGFIWYMSFDLPTVYKNVYAKSGIEYQDIAVLDAIIDQPWVIFFGTGAGNIHHLAGQYLDTSLPLFLDRAFKPNNGILFIVSDTGIFGYLIIFSAITLSLIWARDIYLPSDGRIMINYFSAFLLFVFLAFNLRYTEYLYLAMGGLFSALACYKKNTFATKAGNT